MLFNFLLTQYDLTANLWLANSQKKILCHPSGVDVGCRVGIGGDGWKWGNFEAAVWRGGRVGRWRLIRVVVLKWAFKYCDYNLHSFIDSLHKALQ